VFGKRQLRKVVVQGFDDRQPRVELHVPVQPLDLLGGGVERGALGRTVRRCRIRG
jgi:hypothetical protein